MNILIADDHAIVRKGLIQLLKEDFPAAKISEVSDGIGVFQQVKDQVWDIILLDISMPGRNGIETLKQLRSMGVKTPILILSMYPEEQYAIRALKAGASAFINKENTTEELRIAVTKVLSGRKYITNTIAERLLEDDEAGDRPAHARLSDRELQVLQLIGFGKTVSEIGEALSLSVNTISTYRARILKKLYLSNNAELARYALENGLV